jgi:hypothetical protein
MRVKFMICAFLMIFRGPTKSVLLFSVKPSCYTKLKKRLIHDWAWRVELIHSLANHVPDQNFLNPHCDQDLDFDIWFNGVDVK